MSQDFITKVYNAFNPFEPLQPDDPAYVNCSTVRGNDNIFREIGSKIIRSNQSTCQLYTGHRGVGKSTELLRLKQYLENNGCFVVYFGATEGDIDEQDAQYTDILLACTRHIIDQLKDYANPIALETWLKSRFKALKEVALSEIEIKDDSITVQQQIGILTKLTATIRRVPDAREEIRKQVNLHSLSLLDALNEFINDAQNEFLKGEKPNQKIVVIADNLDRIVPITRGENKSNHEEIFIDYNSQLTSLNCHVVYTVPISLVYSQKATELRNIYDTPQVLPMIMVKNPNNENCQPGLEKLKEIIFKRIMPFLTEENQKYQDIDNRLFDREETRLTLCRNSGGHVRDLMLSMQSSMDYVDDFPITEDAVNWAVNDATDNTYRLGVYQNEWAKLAQVSVDKKILNEDEYRSLLFRRCVLEYRCLNQQGKNTKWHDVHPLLEATDEFQQALQKLSESQTHE